MTEQLQKLRDKISEYLTGDAVKGLSPHTQMNYSQGLTKFWQFCQWKRVDCFETQVNLADYVKHMKLQGLSGKSIQQHLTYAKIFLKYSGIQAEYTYRLTNQEKKENKRKQLKRWFSAYEVAKCLTYPFDSSGEDQRLKCRILIRLLAETGARVRELANLKAEDIDIGDFTIWLMDSKTEPRPAFFSPKTQELLAQWQISRAFAWTDRIFPTAERINQIVNELLDILELNGPGRGPHTFRHYVATQLFYDGRMRIEDISFLLGTSVDIIVKTYLHPTPLMLKDRVFRAMKWED